MSTYLKIFQVVFSLSLLQACATGTGMEVGKLGAVTKAKSNETSSATPPSLAAQATVITTLDTSPALLTLQLMQAREFPKPDFLELGTEPSASPVPPKAPPLERITAVRLTTTAVAAGVQVTPVYLDAQKTWVAEPFEGDVTITYHMLSSELGWELCSGKETLNQGKPAFITEGTLDNLHDILKTDKVSSSYNLTLPDGRLLSGRSEPIMTKTEFQALQQANSPTNETNQSGQPLRLKFRAAVIRNNGEMIPVTNTLFTLIPATQWKIRKNLVLQNKAPDKPTGPNLNDKKYQKNCATAPICLRDLNTFLQDLKLYQETKLAEWEKVAYAGEEAKLAESPGQRLLTIKTDLEGNAAVDLSIGTWYAQGRFDFLGGLSTVIWDGTPVIIAKTSGNIDLTNEQGQVTNVP